MLQEKETPNVAPDEAGVFSVSVDMAQVKASREEFILLFGSAQTEQSNREELRVKFLDRVVLGPFTAKRLLSQLVYVVRKYESTHGSLTEALRSQNRPMSEYRLPFRRQWSLSSSDQYERARNNLWPDRLLFFTCNR